MMNKMMKKVAIVFAALTMATTCVTPAFANDGFHTRFLVEAASGTKTVTASEANVRREPSTDADVMYTLSNGETVTINGVTDNGWYLLPDGGYVRADLLSDNDTPQPEHDGQTYTVSVQSGYLALRNSPEWTDDDSNVIEELNNGQKFTVTEKNGQYWYGYSNSTGNWGYVNHDYLY